MVNAVVLDSAMVGMKNATLMVYIAMNAPLLGSSLPKPAEAPKQQPVATAPAEVKLDKYEAMDSRVRTGAYRIVGLDHKEKVKEGDNLLRITKRTLGPGMECYIEVYNGLNATSQLKTGQEIKIPKVERKKKKTAQN